MPYIHLTTFIKAPAQRVFDLSRSVDVHVLSMKHTEERPVAGTTKGLLNRGDSITWQARHFYKLRTLQVEITSMNVHTYFVDERISGDLKKLKHEHHFKPVENGTLMIDQFYYELPYGLAGRLIEKFYMNNYMRQLLEKRNNEIKSLAEGEQWKQILP